MMSTLCPYHPVSNVWLLEGRTPGKLDYKAFILSDIVGY